MEIHYINAYLQLENQKAQILQQTTHTVISCMICDRCIFNKI